jgi:hypothetical protein
MPAERQGVTLPDELEPIKWPETWGDYFILYGTLTVYLLGCCCVIVGGLWCIAHAFHLAFTALTVPPTCVNPALNDNANLFSTAGQLASLQDQLLERMTLHNEAMSNYLDNFTTILTDITAETDLAIGHVQVVLTSLDTGHTSEEWRGAVDMIIDEAKKLHNITVSDDLRLKVEAVKQIVGIIAAEMADMELFIQNTSNSANALVNGMGMIADCQTIRYYQKPDCSPQNGGYDAPITDINAPIVEAVPGQPMQWSWDEIIDGRASRAIGFFTPAQQQIIESKFSTSPFQSPSIQTLSSLPHFPLIQIPIANANPVFIRNQHPTKGTNGMIIPSIVRYGIGLPDTYPQDLRTFGYEYFSTLTMPALSVLDNSGQKYSCDIVGHFAKTNKNSCVMIPRLFHRIFSFWPRCEFQLYGLQSLECWSEGEEKRDVVRQGA